jgi:diguanylate cyclase (GGDEF)-like protein
MLTVVSGGAAGTDMKLERIATPEPVLAAASDSVNERPVRRPSGWAVLAVGVALSGCAVSLVAARGETDTDARNSRQRFETTAHKIASSLDAALQHEEDLAVGTGAIVVGNPHITTGELATWISSIRAQRRYPELLGVGAVIAVQQSDLEAFVAQLRADPAHPLGPSGKLVLVPSGVRPFYCLLQATVTLGAVPVSAPFGLDYCAGDLAAQILAARDSGNASIFAIPSENGTALAVHTPIYRGGLIPETIEGRRAAYLGAIGTAVSPAVLFAGVLRDDPGATITLMYDGASSAVFSNRVAVAGAESVHEELGEGWSATISEPTRTSGVVALDVVALAATGGIASLLLGVLIFSLGTGRRRALRMVARRTDELQHQALHDSLTGLPNRTLILDRVEQMLARCRRNGTVGAALYIDLDGFKGVNDTLGHEAGDQLLQAMATRLATSLRGVDTIGRMGGDEFVALVEVGSLQVAPEHVAERLLEVMREPFELDRAMRPIVVSTSIGIASGDRLAAGDLLRDADIALYRAKAAGRNCYQMFRPDMETAVQHQHELEFDLRSALDHQQFRLFYQPIYDLSDLSIVGAEALIRWQHPTRGLLPPDEFIPLLESSGHIVEVGRWVLLTACAQAQEWLDGGNNLAVSVNVSARQLDRDSIIDHVAEALAASNLDPARLIVEITETALMIDTELTARRLQALKGLGVQLAIDDFGTGYSSLAYLQRFPVDCLKIDRTFIDAVTRSPESNAMIRTLVQLGKDLGLRTLAEGVETTAQLDHLRGEAIDQAQGFLLARPLSAADFGSQLLLQTPRPLPA